ncbi:AraC family transcriptional regulator [Niastella sp. OAS944]|uniref:AraC family transcriptional regulator n=1 Tax=Niastella sp. OAS944 TaxID=2664089 RepID=UPI00348AACDA|nr:AraC-like DNA-binding protein [Chitinophagaceae bacterium OAS944]
MKSFVQQSELPHGQSLVVQTCGGTYFEGSRNPHTGYEIILFTKGAGLAFIGNYVETFAQGDIFFLGTNMPHYFQKKSKQQLTGVVVHFDNDFFSQQFTSIPECSQIKKLFNIACYGLKFIGNSSSRLNPLLKMLETSSEINRIILLLQCLQIMATANEYILLSTHMFDNKSYINKNSIERVVQFTFSMFKEPVTLLNVASIACMSTSTFCRYFKQYTQKTYTFFLNEVRINYACDQLIKSNKSVRDIAFESGYNTTAHFHRQFIKIKQTTPLQYRNFSTSNNCHL